MPTTIEISDYAAGYLKQVMLSLHADRVRPVIGRAGVNRVKDHFRELEVQRPNKLGGKRTHYWAQAARGTHYRIEPDSVVVGINQIGVALHYHGGTVHPGKNISRVTGQPTRYLTIPATAEAHGRRAGEFPNLRFAITPQGPALVQADAVSSGGGKKAASAGKVYFRLVRKVDIDPDPGVLPTEQEIAAAIQDGIDDYLRSIR